MAIHNLPRPGLRERFATFALDHILQHGGPFERIELALRLPAHLGRLSHLRLHQAAKAHHAKRHPVQAPANVRAREQMSLMEHLGLFITEKVGTMPCAFLFTGLSLISLPAAIASHDPIIIVAWVAQTFLQLVLLPVIIVGGNLQSRHTELRAEADFEVNQAAATDIKAILAHLDQQDTAILDIVQRLRQPVAAN